MDNVKSVPAVSGVAEESNHGVSSSSFRSSSDLSDSSSWSFAPPDWDQDVRVPCKSPIVINGTVAGCGKCIACRSRAAKVWGTRIQLEMAGYAENIFITLTYDPEHLPAEGSLHKRQLSGFIKRLRARLLDKTGTLFRFFACGEYGSRTGRAHYHAILFGVGSWAEPEIRASWPFGFVSIAPCDGGVGNYVSGYCVKKLNSIDRAPREPEFILMSRRPGIGARFADTVAEDALRHPYWHDAYGDIQGVVNVGSYKLAIGGYLKRRIRTGLHGSPHTPATKVRAQAEAVLKVYDAAAEDGKKADFSNPVRALQIEQKFNRSRSNETF